MRGHYFDDRDGSWFLWLPVSLFMEDGKFKKAGEIVSFDVKFDEFERLNFRLSEAADCLEKPCRKFIDRGKCVIL